MHHNVEPCGGAEQQKSECRLSKAASEQYSAVQQLCGVEQQSSGCNAVVEGKERKLGQAGQLQLQLKLRSTSIQLRATQSLLLIRSSAVLFILNASHVHGLQKSKKFKIQRKAIS